LFPGHSIELRHRAFCQARSIGRARIERSHATALPTEDRFQLPYSRAVVCRPGRADLADGVCGLRDARGVAGIAEEIAERLFRQWPAVLAANECEVSARASLKDFIKGGQDGNATVIPVFSVRLVVTPSRAPQ